MANILLPNMHDWTLLAVDYDWATMVVTIRFLTTDGPITLIASKASDLHIPQLNSWGPSVSVNAAELTGEGAVHIMRIEMQSGDVITVEAAVFEVR